MKTTGAAPPRFFAVIVATGFEGALVLLWLFLCKVAGAPPSAQGSASPEALVAGAAATVPLLPLIWWAGRSRLGPVRRIMEVMDRTLVPFLSPMTLTDFFLLSLLAGVGEEGIFRGILQSTLQGHLPVGAAIVIAAAVFGLLHFVTPAYALMAGILGAYLGALHALTGNVVVPMTAHCLYDFAALVYLVKVRRRSPGRAGIP